MIGAVLDQIVDMLGAGRLLWTRREVGDAPMIHVEITEQLLNSPFKGLETGGSMALLSAHLPISRWNITCCCQIGRRPKRCGK